MRVAIDRAIAEPSAEEGWAKMLKGVDDIYHAVALGRSWKNDHAHDYIWVKQKEL